MNRSTDQSLRTISDDGTFRVLLASTTETARGVLNSQNQILDETGTLLIDQVSATLLLRLTMSPDYRLQTILQHPQAGSSVVDSHPDGTTRAMIRRPLDIPFEFGEGTHLAVHRAMFGGELHQGIVETTAHQNLSDVITGYLHRSEQISSVVGLAQEHQNEQFLNAGGYIVQLLPASDHATLALMTARLEQMPSASELFQKFDYDLHQVATELYGPIGFHELGKDQFFWGCTCDRERILDALATLSREDIEELKADGEVLEIGCDYCNKVHQIEVAELRQ